MTGIPTLTDKTIVERRGDDVRDRHAAAVLDHPVAEKVAETVAEAKESGPKHYVDHAGTGVYNSDVKPAAPEKEKEAR